MTTATVMKLFHDNSGNLHCMVASVGDSRAYLWRDNQLMMLTIDHASGLIGMTDAEKMRQQSRLAEVASDRELGLSLARAFYNRNAVSQVLGGGYNSNDVCIKDLLLQAGDSLILTTDGVHDNLTSSEMMRLIGSVADDPDRISEALVAAAIARSREGGFRSKPDDMTAVVVGI
jgi:protein phosphatase